LNNPFIHAKSFFIFEISGLKKKSHNIDQEEEDDDDEQQQTKSTEPKRRAQVFAKSQDETPTTHDIKSMFAATKTRTVQRQELVFQYFIQFSIQLFCF
jgi:hypothetical protein